MKNDNLIILKKLGSSESTFVTSSEEAEKYFIQILEENNYTMKEMAKFFGIKERAMYYKREKLQV